MKDIEGTKVLENHDSNASLYFKKSKKGNFWAILDLKLPLFPVDDIPTEKLEEIRDSIDESVEEEKELDVEQELEKLKEKLDQLGGE